MSTEKIVINRSLVNVFGNACAESEKILDQYYLYSDFTAEAESFESVKTFFIGRTGVGKSAIINAIKKKTENLKSKNNKIIIINPEDFAFDVFERSEIIKGLIECDFNLSLVFKSIWLSIFVSEILKATYGTDKKGAINRIFLTWGAESKAYKFLEKNNEINSDLSIADKVRSIIERAEHELSLSVNLNDLGGAQYKFSLTPEQKNKINKTLQGLEIAEIRYFIGKFNEEILRDKKIYIVVDDLDKNWLGNEVSKKFIGALFECISTFANLQSVKIIVSLRTNLFEQIDLYQPEKFQQYIQKINWEEDFIHRICKKRMQVIFNDKNNSGIYYSFFPKEMHLDSKKTKTFDEYLISRSNNRPRDAIIFISYMLAEGIGQHKVKQAQIFQAEEKYSRDRLNALFKEWENPYKGVSFLQDYFSYQKYKMSYSDLRLILDSIFDLVERNKDENEFIQRWILEKKLIDLESLNHFKFLEFIYKIGLIGYKPTGASKVKYSFTDNDLIMKSNLNEDARFYINPCYYKALETKFN